MKIRNKASILFIAYLLSVSLVYATYKLTITGKYTVVAEEITPNPLSIDFGNVTRGSLTQRLVTLTNTGTYDFKSLRMTHDFSSLEGNLTWNGEGKSLAVGESLDVLFTLAISQDATLGADFPLEIYIEE